MKIITIFTILMLIACKNKNIDFCKMLDQDQSYVTKEGASQEKFESDIRKRKANFKNNFSQIIKYSKHNGFPKMGSLKATGLDSCRNWAVWITLFHVGQTQPKIFFEKESIDVITTEIDQGRLNSKDLFAPLREGFGDHEFCLKNKSEIYAALNSWQIDLHELPKIKFVECNYADH